MLSLSKATSTSAALTTTANGRAARRHGGGTRLVNAISMTLLVVLRVYMVAVAGVVACRVIGFW
jgi:hypothetical protein